MKNYVCLFLLAMVSVVSLGQTITYNFEEPELQEWYQSPASRWVISTTAPLSGLGSLKHGAIGDTDIDRISVPLPDWDDALGSLTWRFKVNHGYAPSGFNHWGVFISSDRDAEGMVAAQNPNGYVVGVNLKGSDDILKLYRVSNGVFTPIVSTGINWESDIKTSGIGAVEIERKVDGTFNVSASTTGSFLDLAYQGEAVDISYPIAGYFGIYYRYTASGAGKLMVDDISFTYKSANLNDHLAQVLQPTQQVSGGILSSAVTSVDMATEVMRFSIKESGSTDGLPVKPTKLRFAKVNSESSTNWPETIGGVKLTSNSSIIPLEAVYLSDNAITVEVNENAITIPDNGELEFSLWLYLKAGNIVDGATVQLRVDDTGHGWETFENGSEFAETFPLSVQSEVFVITVIPSHLSFVEYPNPWIVNKPSTVVAHGTDIEGNLAQSFTGGQITLGADDNGLLSPQDHLTESALNGVVTWTGIIYPKPGKIILHASAQSLEPAASEVIEVIYEPTSVVVSPGEQVVERSVSSTQNTMGKAIEVFRFGIADLGEFDLMQTQVRQIVIKRPTVSNPATFNANIGGILLKVNGQVVPIGNPNILSASITIPLPEGALVVTDGKVVEVSLWMFLKSSGLTDGANLRFMIDATNHGFIADNSGSTFGIVFPQEVVSSTFTIEVVATRLLFSAVPQYVGLDEPFSIEVSAIDAGGNLDVNAIGNVSISKNLGDGSLQVNSSNALKEGKAKWSDLTYSYFSPQPFNLLASNVNLDNTISPLIYCSDRDTKLQQPTNSLSDGSINALAVTREDAVEVLTFGILDAGTTDKLPTQITQLVFRSQEQLTDISLNKAIGGVLLLVDGEEISPAGITITKNTITLTFSEDALVIGDGATVNVSLSIYLKSGGQVDGSTISLYVPQSGHGWQTSLLGSGFPVTFESGLIGPTLTVAVVGTTLSFFEQPFITSVFQSFSLTAVLTDALRNIDRGTSAEVTLGLDQGPGSFSLATPNLTLADGFVQWVGVELGSVGKYRFKANDRNGLFASAVSETIWNGAAYGSYIDENFENETLAFDLSSHWDVSTVSPIDGTRSLKHALSGEGGASYLPIPLVVANLNDSPMEWSFVMRNGAWDPSADNAFWFVLASDKGSIKPGDFSGYAVGVNLSGTSDLISLWRIDSIQPPRLLIQSDFDWDESETVRIRTTRTPDGEWSLWYQTQASPSSFRLAGKATDGRHTLVETCGPAYKYTASRAGELWIDNIKVSVALYPPIIHSARLANLTTVDVNFSSPVRQSDAENVSNYTITDEDGSAFRVVKAYVDHDNPARVSLRTEQLPLKLLKLKASSIKSIQGTTTVDDSITIGLGAAGTFGNIIINEIMARPIPAIGLPKVEYIELYNRTENPISLKGWRLRGNINYVTIPDITIQPKGYLLLSSVSGASEMLSYGPVVGVTSFPTLLVGGMLLAIYDNSNNLISWTEYADTWYKSDSKKAGGYSLERIDTQNLVEGAENWIASNDPSGGTPGRKNSVQNNNPDQVNPWISLVKVISSTQIEVRFSEPMDSLSITLVSNYTINKGIGNPIWSSTNGPRYNSVSLTFEKPITTGEAYDICFNQSIVDFSGNGIEADCMSFAIHQEPAPLDIVINEVLFNPYTGGVDFVEIFNRSDKNFDLNELFIANRKRTTLELDENYRASELPWYLLPNSFAVLTVDPSLVEQFYYVANPNAIIRLPRMPGYPNDNGYVVLQTEQGLVIDEFAYSDKMQNTLLADVKGVSLERIHPDMSTIDASSWQSAAQTAGFATPTAQNSQFTEPTASGDEFTLSHQVFSPDGDGFEDFVMINYELPESGYLANIMVFDSRGRRIKWLAANVTLGTSGNITWNGTTDAGSRATMGAYVIYIEAFDLRGHVKRLKKTVVVATKLR